MSSMKFDSTVFKERIFDLMEKQNVTIKQIVNDKEGDISFAWFSKLRKNAIKSPSADIVYTLADYFGVSSDYLLGLSDVPTTDADLRAVCEYTGLSQAAIDSIREFKEDEIHGNVDEVCNTLSKILASKHFRCIVSSINAAVSDQDFLYPNGAYITDSIRRKINGETIPEIYRKAIATLAINGLASVYKYEISERAAALFDEVVGYENT